MPDRKSYPANTSKQRLAIPAEPGRQAVTLEDRDALAKYNASQKPPQSVKAYLQKVLSPGGGSELNTGNGIMGSRAYAPPPPSILKQPIGAGIGVGPGGPAFAAEAMSPGPQAALPAAPVHAAQHGPVQQALAQNLMPEAQPYREGQGARTMAVRQPVPPWAQQQQAAAQNLTGPMGSGYSPGAMTLQARQRAMGQADTMGLPREARAALQQRIQAGDYGAVDRAAAMVSGVGDPRALSDSRVSQELARRLLGGQEAADFDARKAQDVAHYKDVARQHTEQAKVQSALAQQLGLDPLASQHDVRGEQQRRLRASYQQADQATLEHLAAGGDHLAAEALRGGTMPGFTGPVQGVRARTEATNKRVLDEAQQRALDLAHQRFVVPKEIQADADQHVAQYAAQGRVDAATIAAASKAPGNSTDAAALRAWGVQMGERQKLGYPTVPLQAWAQQNQVPLSPALMGKPSAGTPSLATPAAPVGAGPAGGRAQGFSFNPAQQTQIQQLTPQAIANLQSIIAAGPSNPDYAEAVAIMQARGGQ